MQRNRLFLLAVRRGLPKASDCTLICGVLRAIVGAPSAASLRFLLDVRRFCWGLLDHRRYADEGVPIGPGQKGTAFLGLVVFCRPSLKPAHIEQKNFETWCRERFPHASLAENVLSGANNASLLRQWTVFKKGESVELDDRLSDIANRCGKDSREYSKAEKLSEHLTVKGFSFASDMVLDKRSVPQD